MAATIESTAANVKPLTGAIVRRLPPGEEIAAGAIVAIESDGYLDESDSTSTDEVVGIAIQAATGALVPKLIDVVVLGPIKCITSGTPGATVFNSTTAGEPSESSGGNNTAVGYCESATVIFVLPEHLV